MNPKTKGLLDAAKALCLWLVSKLRQSWRWYKGLYKGAPWYKKLGVGVLSFIAFVIFYVFAVSVNLFWLFGKSPSLHDIRHPKTAQASEIYSADGKLLGKFFNENRTPVPYDSINPVFFQALISTEDERFYQHHGIDFKGLFAAAKDAMRGHARGASTITQQLVKNMFRVRTEYSTGLLGLIPGVKILIMKSKEMIIAVELEMFCSKKEILTMYANTVDFGSNAYGIKTAAKTYFDTTPKALKTEEAAVLVGLLKATSAYNPKINPKNSLKRRNVVLDNMRIHQHLTTEECDSLKDLPIKLNFNIETAYDGKALYFRQAVADYIEKKCPDLDPYSDGLKIYTTLDSKMQAYAEEAVRKQMQVVQRNFNNHWGNRDPWIDENGNVIPGFIEDIARKTDTYKALLARFPDNADSINYYMNLPHKVKLFDYKGEIEKTMSVMDSIRYMVKFMHTGFVAMEPSNGYVRAWVGDIDFGSWKYDKVKSMRQPGSTFKLFVYATAMKEGLTPSYDGIQDSPISMQVYDKRRDTTELWQPHNANGNFSYANMPLRSAFARSVNTIAVKLGQQVGIGNVIQTAKAMGINSPLDDTPSLALGSSDVNLLEMVDAYACVANNGVHVDPVLVTKIQDSNGNTIWEASPTERTALPYKAAFYMQQCLLAGTHDAGGTSMSLGAYIGNYPTKLDYGGKTGTSNNHSDAWFIGVTPNLVGGAWVGGEYRSIHFRTGALGQGSRTALPIFGLFMQKVLADPTLRSKYMAKFGAPTEDIDPSTYQAMYNPPAKVVDTTFVDSTAIDNSDLMDDPNAEGASGGEEQNAENGSVEGHNGSAANSEGSSNGHARKRERHENSSTERNENDLMN